MQPDVLEAIRELHKPSGEMHPDCEGCDAEGWEAWSPSWPCRTAALVYTAEEIADVKRLSERCQAEARERRDIETRSQVESIVSVAYSDYLTKLITDTPLFDALRKAANGAA